MNYKKYSDLLDENQGTKISYSALLSAEEWQQKRIKIINRENNICQICHTKCMDDFLLKNSGSYLKLVPATYEDVDTEKERSGLYDNLNFTYTSQELKLVAQKIPKIPHVHHKYYVLNNLPWEYPDEALMLVCHSCHSDVHQTEKIKVFTDSSLQNEIKFTPCQRCNGTGYLPEFDYFQNGVCFTCNGNLFEQTLTRD